jgi:O-antigen ligase
VRLPRIFATGSGGANYAAATCLVAAFGFAIVFGWALALERWRTVVVLAVAACLPIVAHWPVVSTFGLYVLVVPFDAIAWISQEGQGASVTRLIGMLAVVALISTGLMERRLVRPPSPALWFGGLLLWALLSSLWAVDAQQVFKRLPTAFSLFALYLIAVSIRPSQRELNAVCLLMVIGGVAAAATGYAFSATGDAAVRGGVSIGERVSNPNSLGSVLILPLAITIGAFVESRGTMRKLLTAIGLGILGLGVYASMSRGALLAAFVTILVLLYRVRIRWQVLGAIVLLLIVALALPGAYFTRVNSALTGEDATGSGRTQIWANSLTLLDRFWVSGAGLSNFASIAEREFRPLPGASSDAHNTYLSTWVELGVPGLALLVIAIAAHFIGLRKARGTGGRETLMAALEAACYGTLTAAFFGDHLWSKHFWLPWILLIWAGPYAMLRAAPTPGQLLAAEEHSDAMGSRLAREEPARVCSRPMGVS